MSAEITTIAALGISDVVAAGGTPGALTLLLNFGSFEKGIRESIANANMMRGEYSQRINRIRTAKFASQPSLEMAPTAVELARLLDWSLGGVPSGTAYTLGDGVRLAQLMYNDRTTVWVMAETAVNTLSLRSSDGDPTLHATLGLLAKNCTSGGTFTAGIDPFASPPVSPAPVVDGTTQPFVHQDTTVAGTSQVVVNSAATKVQSIEIDINNHLNTERFFNSQTLTGFVKEDRSISLKLTYPFGDFPSLYAAAAAENTGIPVTITYTCGNTSVLFSFANVLFPREPVRVPLKSEVVHQITGIALRTVSTECLVVTLDSSP